jgi:hypothetical protein
LGVDFSGDHAQWRASRRKSNVWIAEIGEHAGGLFLADLDRVQALPGTEGELPFARLAARLRRRDFAAAAIDAPFSVPAARVPEGGHAGLVTLVAGLDRGGRPFPTGRRLVQALDRNLPPRGRKEHRETERRWGVNVRSALWNGPRGGAPMTAACLTLLAEVGRSVWPWTRCGPGLLVEAFPAAQLKRWGLPHQRYNGVEKTAKANRKRILDGLDGRLLIAALWRERVLESADALDAVVCAFAARAVTEERLAQPPAGPWKEEGWIAVREADAGMPRATPSGGGRISPEEGKPCARS